MAVESTHSQAPDNGVVECEEVRYPPDVSLTSSYPSNDGGGTICVIVHKLYDESLSLVNRGVHQITHKFICGEGRLRHKLPVVNSGGVTDINRDGDFMGRRGG